MRSTTTADHGRNVVVNKGQTCLRSTRRARLRSRRSGITLGGRRVGGTHLSPMGRGDRTRGQINRNDGYQAAARNYPTGRYFTSVSCESIEVVWYDACSAVCSARIWLATWSVETDSA